MDQLLLENAEKLVQYREKLYKKMSWEMSPNETAIAAAFLFLTSEKEIDESRYDECKAVLKKTVGLFHEFRSYAKPVVLAKMMLQEDPESYLKGAIEVYEKFKMRHKLTVSPFVVMASLTIYEKGGVEKADEYLDEIDRLYTDLKKDHPMLITSADYGFLAILVTSELKEEEVAKEIEENYQALKEITIDRDAVLSLCQALSLPSSCKEDKARRVNDLISGLAAKDRPISKSYGLPAIGALSLVDLPVEGIIEKVIEADDFLSNKKGFRINGGRIRRVFAALLVLSTYGKKKDDNTVGNIAGTMAIEIVEEIVMLLVISCICTSISVASSSH